MRRSVQAALTALALVATGLVAGPAGAADVAPLEVVVTNRGGGPLKGAEVSISRGGALVAKETADSRGRVEVPVFAGDYSVTATFGAMCASPAPVSATVTHASAAPSRVNLVIDGVSVITGRLTADGAPAVGAELYAYPEDHSDPPRDLGVSDADGRYAFDVCPGKAYVVVAAPPRASFGYFATYFGNVTRGTDAATISVPQDGVAQADIEMFTQLGSVTGKVVDAKGKPLADVQFTMRATNRSAEYEGRTDKSGRFRLDGILRATYRVTAGTKKSGSATKTVTVTPKKTTSVTLKARPTGKVRVAIRLPAKISKRVHVGVTVLDSKGQRVGSTDNVKNGAGTISNLRAGTYRVVLDGTNISKRVAVRSGKTTRVSFTRPAGTTISGTVRKANGKPLAKGRVLVEDQYGTELGAVTTTSKGKYIVRGAVQGRYVVRPPSWFVGDESKARSVAVTKGKAAKANLRFDKPGTVTGTVRTDGDKPAASVWVLLQDSWGQTPMDLVYTDKHGRFSAKVPPGRYTIRIVDGWDDEGGGGYFHATSKSPVTVKAGKTTTAPAITVTTK